MVPRLMETTTHISQHVTRGSGLRLVGELSSSMLPDSVRLDKQQYRRTWHRYGAKKRPQSTVHRSVCVCVISWKLSQQHQLMVAACCRSILRAHCGAKTREPSVPLRRVCTNLPTSKLRLLLFHLLHAVWEASWWGSTPKYRSQLR
jgi:hypothetical protein